MFVNIWQSSGKDKYSDAAHDMEIHQGKENKVRACTFHSRLVSTTNDEEKCSIQSPTCTQQLAISRCC